MREGVRLLKGPVGLLADQEDQEDRRRAFLEEIRLVRLWVAERVLPLPGKRLQLQALLFRAVRMGGEG